MLVCVDGGAVEVVVGVTDGGMENELMIFLGYYFSWIHQVVQREKKKQIIFAMRNWWYWCRCKCKLEIYLQR